jgi:hypothetical protein
MIDPYMRASECYAAVCRDDRATGSTKGRKVHHRKGATVPRTELVIDDETGSRQGIDEAKIASGADTVE